MDGVPENFHNYFVAVFDKDFKWKHTWKDDWKLKKIQLNSEGDHVGAIIGFETKLGEEEVMLRSHHLLLV
jgi:hypothetical protein